MKKKRRERFDWRGLMVSLVIGLLLQLVFMLFCWVWAHDNFTEKNTYTVSGVCTGFEAEERGGTRRGQTYITIEVDGAKYFVTWRRLWSAGYDFEGGEKTEETIKAQLYGKNITLGVRDIFFSVGGTSEIGSIATEEKVLLSLAETNVALDANDWVANLFFVMFSLVTLCYVAGAFLEMSSGGAKRSKKRKKKKTPSPDQAQTR